MFRRRVASEVRTESALCTPYYIGVNAIFLPLIPYAIATGLLDTHCELALILSTAFSGGIILVGVLFRFAGGYRTWPYAFELFTLVVNAVMLGVSFPEEPTIIKYHNFITNAFYATFGFLSIMAGLPYTIQYVREFVPKAAATHEKVLSSAYLTTGVWTFAFVTNTLIYLVPICRGKEWHHMNALNLLFRIILPIFFFFFAVLFTRLWPVRVLHHLIGSAGFDSAVRKVVVNPLAFPEGSGGLPPPPYGPGSAIMPPPAIHVHAVAS